MSDDAETARSRSNGCVPPGGQTYLSIGQDLFAIDGYIRDAYNFTLHQYLKNNLTTWPPPQRGSIQPAAVMAYTDLSKLLGLNQPVDYGSGIEYADGLLQQGSHALQIGLWLGGTAGCLQVLNGELDDSIARLQTYLARTPAQHVFLRVGYEFDNPAFDYHRDPDVYRIAYRTLVDQLRHLQWKVDFVWHSWGASVLDSAELERYYPGDDYVDWVGVSLFQQFYHQQSSPEFANNHSQSSDFSGGTLDTVRTVLDFAQTQQKPIMIAESAPFGGIDQLSDPWNEWFQPVLDLIEEYDIAMWSYINCDWRMQPMWRNVGFGDTRLSVNYTVQELWHNHVVQNPRFLLASQTWWWNHCRHPGGMLLSQILGNSLVASLQQQSSQSWQPQYGVLGGAVLLAVVVLGLVTRYWLSQRRRRTGIDPSYRIVDDDKAVASSSSLPEEQEQFKKVRPMDYGTLASN